jgi:hypothetical protein
MRNEHLNGQIFDSLLEAQVLTEDWRIDHNNKRPHSAHGWLTPVVRGHEKVPGYGHLRSPLVATKVPAFGHEKSPPLTEVST